jgi:hypothetical protein
MWVLGEKPTDAIDLADMAQIRLAMVDQKLDPNHPLSDRDGLASCTLSSGQRVQPQARLFAGR